ncbi:MAG TPA: aminomethyl-transferring glycine dehydrogenase subunit GcvPA [Gammaproteobacteria bacterium]|nr:aminomethyl-transferring glycine dehydrogenase subunit GcvPA [Gammaproteobacteria bacterium]
MAFIPHTQDDLRQMLAVLGIGSIDELFDEIPEALRARGLHGMPQAVSELEVTRLMQRRAAEDDGAACFIGAGAYEHHIPAAVWQIATRGEFYSAYTPYQAEASQGTLQLIYEYQTMIAGLTAMEVANASLYDGASALAEAVLMAVRSNRKSASRQVLVPRSVHPAYRRVVETIVGAQDIRLEYVDYDRATGRISLDALAEWESRGAAALVIPQPNFFGQLEEADTLTDWAARNDALAIALVNPLALAILKPPGEWGAQGADIACGEGQPLGVPLSSGGPYFGLMATSEAYLRQMPGRLVGRSLDADGKPGFTLTLQAREQHIRRSRATSNICTNQGLMVTAAAIYMSLLGPEGLARVAAACHGNTAALLAALGDIEGVERAFAGPFFHEAVLRLERPVAPVLRALAERNIHGGLDLAEHYPELGDALLICVTETKSAADIERYAASLAAVLRE